MAGEKEDHSFDRRVADANLAALGIRIQGLEGRVEVLEQKHETTNLELRANTELTRQMHTKVEAMHEVFETAKNGVKVVTAVGNGTVRVIEVGGRLAKPLFYLAVLAAAVVGFVKTGTWDFKP